MKERLQVVDKNDRPIGATTRENAWSNGLILRHAYIVLRDSNDNFLLQQRSQYKKSSPGQWTWAATGHVDEGEDYKTAAKRELFEEIGIKTKLTKVGKIHSSHPNEFGIIDCFITIYTGKIDHETNIIIDPQEVEAIRWFSPREVEKLVNMTPSKVTYNMRRTYNEFFAARSPASK